jgi:hypothetical protein
MENGLATFYDEKARVKPSHKRHNNGSQFFVIAKKPKY